MRRSCNHKPLKVTRRRRKATHRKDSQNGRHTHGHARVGDAHTDDSKSSKQKGGYISLGKPRVGMLTLLCMSFSRYSSDTSSCSRSRSRSRGRRHKRTRSKSRGRHSRRSRYSRSVSKPRKSSKRSHRSKSKRTHRDRTPERHGRQGAPQQTTSGRGDGGWPHPDYQIP